MGNKDGDVINIKPKAMILSIPYAVALVTL